MTTDKPRRGSSTRSAPAEEDAPARAPLRRLTLVFVGDPVEGATREDVPRALPLAAEPVVIGREPHGAGLVVPDEQASRRHAELTYAAPLAGYVVRDLGSKNGTYVNGERISRAVLLEPGAVLRIGSSLLVYGEAEAGPDAALLAAAPATTSLARARVELTARRVAPARHPVLVIGPTGAGKELIAALIHAESGRRGRLVSVNSGALPKELLASELFGHVRGAFSGAVGAREGVFRAADGGTLFLDEIGELPPDQQAAFLRVLQDGRVRPVGGDQEYGVDVRVVAATNRRLDLVPSFRADLYARLSSLVIELPGLDRRREEILPLLQEMLGPERGILLSPSAAEALLLYAWPGNVREVQSVANYVRVHAEPGESVTRRALPLAMQGAGAPGGAPFRASVPSAPTRDALIGLLMAHQGNVAAIARAMGKDRVQVYRWMSAYDLDAGAYRARDE